MNRKLQKIYMCFLCCAMVFVLACDALIYKAFLYNPNQVTTRYLCLQDSSIPASLNQVSIVYISDLEYDPDGQQDERMENLFAQINDLHPDLFLFGGDLFASNAQCSDEARARMAGWLSSVQARLGKFAVYGEQDLIDEQRKAIVLDVYAQSQIELLDNASLPITNQSKDGITLAGLSPQADVDSMLSNGTAFPYVLLLSHWPDNLGNSALGNYSIGYALAGNSHGSQIDWPLLGGYKVFTGSETINRDKTPALSFPYTITSGVGCIDVDARINSPVEIVYLTLASQ